MTNSENSQDRKCREISNPEADLQLTAPPANRELFKSRFAMARKMNDEAHPPPSEARELDRCAVQRSACSALLGSTGLSRLDFK